MTDLPKYLGVVHCGPSEALIVSGVGYGDQPNIICGGRAIVFPCLQKVQRLSLNIMTLTVYSPRVYTVQGVPISVHGIAQVKISGSNNEMLRSAAEQFGDKKPEEIVHIITETLEGHQREIMAHMTVEEIYRDRKTFSSKVFQVSSSDLVNMGIVVISYTIHDIKDEVGYLRSLGKARTNEVMRDARIGEAEAKMATEIAQAEAELQRVEAKLKNETGVAKAQRDFDIKKAQYDVEVNTARAEAEKAYQLQAASIQQRIQEQNTQVEIVERAKQIEIQEQEMARKEKELQAKIKKPAEAEKYRLEKIAEAERIREILKAEADAEARVMKGEAEAYALELTAKAEAEESMAKKADAWNDFGKAAIVAETLKVIPTVMKEINHPLTWGQLSSIKVVNNCDGEVGASKVTEDSINIASQLPKLVRALTGVDMQQTMLAIPD